MDCVSLMTTQGAFAPHMSFIHIHTLMQVYARRQLLISLVGANHSHTFTH